MPEIICQICGTPNPPEAVICSMCHSRLGPTPGKTQSLDSAPDQPQSEKENLEWLERVRALNAMDQLAKNGGIPPTPNAPLTIPAPEPEPAVENPDWLYNTRDLTSAQKPAPEMHGAEDLSWLNDLRASTGSLGPPPENPSTAAEVLAAAAFAKHQEKLEEAENLGETQQLAPRSSIPGSASDWLDKLGAIGDKEQLKPGFEESFSTPVGEAGAVVEYDIERATGSLGKAQQADMPAPIPPTAQQPIGESVLDGSIKSSERPAVEVPASESTPKPASELDLAFLDSLLSPSTSEEKTPQDLEGAALPPIISKADEPPAETSQPEPSLSWLTDLQNAPETPLATDLEAPRVTPVPPSLETPLAPEEIFEARSISGIMPPSADALNEPPSDPAVSSPPLDQISQEELDARLLSQFAAPPIMNPEPPAPPPVQAPQDLKNLPGFSSTGLTGLLSSDAVAGMGMEGILPPDAAQAASPQKPQGEPAPPPQPLPPAAISASTPPLEAQTKLPAQEIPIAPPIRAAVPPITQAEAPVLPPKSPPTPSVADSLFRPPPEPMPGVPVPVEPVAEVQPVDIESIQPSEETPDWLKQYSGEINFDEPQSSLFPSQESLSNEASAELMFEPEKPYSSAEPATFEQPLPDQSGLQDIHPSEPKPVIPAASEIQNQDWLNTVINETPATPLDLFKDVEEPRFAPREEMQPDQGDGVSKSTAWVMEPGQHSGFTGPLPDWLQELESDQDAKGSPGGHTGAEEEPIPDLFVSAPANSVSESQPASQTADPEPFSKPEVPGLANLGIQPEDLFQSAPAQEDAASSRKEPSLDDLGIHPEDFFTSKPATTEASESQPDWLSGLPSMQEEEKPVPPPPPPQVLEKGSGSSGLMPGITAANQPATQQPPPPAASPNPAVPIGMDSLPDWISAEPGEGETSDSPGDQPGLAPAEMPGWLEALKPVGLVKTALAGSARPPKQSAPTTGSLSSATGPLTGKTPLPVTTTPLGSSPPVVKSETQQQYAAMMEQVLTRGPAPAEQAPKQKKRSRKLLWVIIVALVLIVLLLFAAVGLGFLPLPQLFSAETVSFHRAIESLPSGVPVLVALEYSPAFAGELNPISMATMEHLAQKEVNVTFISTQPAGPILAEDLLLQINKINPSYDISSKTENLGYLSGGSIGLLGFALHPMSAIRNGWDGQPAWSKPALEGITSLDQFSAVLVLSENADISRDWIEQVQPRLGTAPLLIATSAQTGPLLEPYSASGQVKGLVAGISGAVAYENMTGKRSEGSNLWGLYLAGQIVAVLVILLGLILRVTRDRKNQTDREG